MVMCNVGGWVIMANPGDWYTFGDGSILWGPQRLADVHHDDMITCSGLVQATAVA